MNLTAVISRQLNVGHRKMDHRSKIVSWHRFNIRLFSGKEKKDHLYVLLASSSDRGELWTYLLSYKTKKYTTTQTSFMTNRLKQG